MNQYLDRTEARPSAMTGAQDKVSLPPELALFCRTVLIITLLSVAYCLFMWLVAHRHYPYVWPFYIPAARFNDFTIYRPKFLLFHKAEFFSSFWMFTYPSPVALIYKLFYALSPVDLKAFVIFMLLAFLLPLLGFARALKTRGLDRRGTALLILCVALSWPAMLIVDRANMEVMVWTTLLLATWAFAKGKFWWAAGLFGLAASLKLFPFVFLALFLRRGRYGPLLFGVFTFFAVTLLSLAILGPTVPIAYQGIAKGLSFFHDTYMANYLPGEGGVDHSPLAFYKASVAILTGQVADKVRRADLRAEAIVPVMKLYIPFMALTGVFLYFWRIRKLPWLNQLLILSIASIYFTPFSGDGTLMHLYYSFALCCFLSIDAHRRGLTVPGLKVMLLCFGYLFAIESFVIARGIRFEGQAKCIVIAVLLIYAFRFPLGPTLRPDAEEDPLVFQDASLVSGAGNAVAVAARA